MLIMGVNEMFDIFNTSNSNSKKPLLDALEKRGVGAFQAQWILDDDDIIEQIGVDDLTYNHPFVFIYMNALHRIQSIIDRGEIDIVGVYPQDMVYLIKVKGNGWANSKKVAKM
jgi:hypothetical protein